MFIELKGFNSIIGMGTEVNGITWVKINSIVWIGMKEKKECTSGDYYK